MKGSLEERLAKLRKKRVESPRKRALREKHAKKSR